MGIFSFFSKTVVLPGTQNLTFVFQSCKPVEVSNWKLMNKQAYVTNFQSESARNLPSGEQVTTFECQAQPADKSGKQTQIAFPVHSTLSMDGRKTKYSLQANAAGEWSVVFSEPDASKEKFVVGSGESAAAYSSLQVSKAKDDNGLQFQFTDAVPKGEFSMPKGSLDGGYGPTAFYAAMQETLAQKSEAAKADADETSGKSGFVFAMRMLEALDYKYYNEDGTWIGYTHKTGSYNVNGVITEVVEMLKKMEDKKVPAPAFVGTAKLPLEWDKDTKPTLEKGRVYQLAIPKDGKLTLENPNTTFLDRIWLQLKSFFGRS